MTKATTHFFLVVFHNHQQFSFFKSQCFCRYFLPHFSLLPVFFFFSQVFISPRADGGEKKDSTDASYSSSLLGNWV